MQCDASALIALPDQTEPVAEPQVLRLLAAVETQPTLAFWMSRAHPRIR
jgi:hypothetical protein